MSRISPFEPFESSVEEPTRPVKQKESAASKPGSPMWGMPQGSLRIPGPIGSFSFPNKPTGPTKTVVFDQEHCTATQDVLAEFVSETFPHTEGVETKKLEPLQYTRPPLSEFEQSLRYLINGECMENLSNTPDFILAEYLSACLAAFDVATRQREKWYGRKVF